MLDKVAILVFLTFPSSVDLLSWWSVVVSLSSLLESQTPQLLLYASVPSKCMELTSWQWIPLMDFRLDHKNYQLLSFPPSAESKMVHLFIYLLCSYFLTGKSSFLSAYTYTDLGSCYIELWNAFSSFLKFIICFPLKRVWKIFPSFSDTICCPWVLALVHSRLSCSMYL